ncbi:purine-cytosine permease family protein [Cyclobacterium amurskyense]|uniref:Pedicted L-rhamnose permease, NCS1 Family n=1 Tax=Cyclobacterium amurskyense TaxID=320787 RepID=A0A0H4PFR2_9BACT|nr:membrane protein [Cyclobacterium amurskyense]AKP51668.1 Pedicted L-rhamnose permease, NCS1 Family [Cyclobacterium amurskyense]|tara:strand:- start:25536 stop:26924 length:1389 start_codon:yes stop_codon:yes gene_type:complete
MEKSKSLVDRLNAVNEYEQQPIPSNKLKGWRSFLGTYAGEHTAGTEFVIGPLFVAHGASAIDLVTGLLLGNILAVLSWAFLTAKIAVKTRVTLYYLLEKIAGKKFTLLYNLVNAGLFCFLAGSMIAVSATAVGIPFDMPMPQLTDIYPNNIGWVLTVFGVGAITTLIAMFGFDQVSKFAMVAAPWMIMVFIAAALAVLPRLGVTDAGSFWSVAESTIWTGVPLEGQSKFGFWHILFFAWFCNMAMHIGMADLSLLRYAKKWEQGFSSATGVFLGHFIAWIASGILYSLFLIESKGSLTFAPGPIAYGAVGAAGAICVVIAGWTTANPTLYRAGLAIQSINPKWKTWKVTLFVGLFTTIAACFPGLVMRLLEFVALYGLILMPVGAVIFIDVYLLEKLGLKSNYAAVKGIQLNWSVAITWLVTLTFCLLLNLLLGIEIFFLGLPGWFVAVLVYVIASKLNQKK